MGKVKIQLKEGQTILVHFTNDNEENKIKHVEFMKILSLGELCSFCENYCMLCEANSNKENFLVDNINKNREYWEHNCQ